MQGTRRSTARAGRPVAAAPAAPVLPAAAVLLGALVAPLAARAEDAGLRLSLAPDGVIDLARGDHLAPLAALVVGLVAFAAVTALAHLRARRRWGRADAARAAELNELVAAKERAEAFLAGEAQLLVAWRGPGEEPEIAGDPGLVMDAPVPRRVLGFGSWLAPEHAQALERAVDRLKASGQGFALTLPGLAGRLLAVEGRAAGGRAVMRVREVSGERRELAALGERHARLGAEAAALRALLDAVPHPAWLRGPDGALAFANRAYARAVDLPDGAAAVARGAELLERPAREAAGRAREAGEAWRARVPAVVGGARLLLDAVEAPASGGGAGGMAVDATEAEAARRALKEQQESHARTLHHVPIAVAVFDGAKRLVFHNAAYARLWGLDEAFLAREPTDGEVLDHLRAERRLPEQADWRGWKKARLEAYQSTEANEDWWHLPDGRALHVHAHPSAGGGLTYLFDDVTERIALESRLNALARLQGETLDGLEEGVLVFGSDGRVRLHNPAVARLWGLDEALIAKRPHVEAIVAAAVAAHPTSAPVWDRLRRAVTGLAENRARTEGRALRADGAAVLAASAPLPDGGTLVTFADVSATEGAERMLKERNEALEFAARVREDFVQRTSYELRQPLQAVVGFVQALAAGTAGPLNPRQSEYAGHVLTASEAVLALLNDVLDLASVDSGALDLHPAPLDPREAVEGALAALRDRLAEEGVGVRVAVEEGLAPLVADAKRVRQALFHALAHAVEASARGDEVRIAVRRAPGAAGGTEFRIEDAGPTPAPEALARAFDRFAPRGETARAGRGLSLSRALAELHGGSARIEALEGRGRAVTLGFPAAPAPPSSAAA